MGGGPPGPPPLTGTHQKVQPWLSPERPAALSWTTGTGWSHQPGGGGRGQGPTRTSFRGPLPRKGAKSLPPCYLPQPGLQGTPLPITEQAFQGPQEPRPSCHLCSWGSGCGLGKGSHPPHTHGSPRSSLAAAGFMVALPLPPGPRCKVATGPGRSGGEVSGGGFQRGVGRSEKGAGERNSIGMGLLNWLFPLPQAPQHLVRGWSLKPQTGALMRFARSKCHQCPGSRAAVLNPGPQHGGWGENQRGGSSSGKSLFEDRCCQNLNTLPAKTQG